MHLVGLYTYYNLSRHFWFLPIMLDIDPHHLPRYYNPGEECRTFTDHNSQNCILRVEGKLNRIGDIKWLCHERKAKYYVPIKAWMSSAWRIRISLPLVDLSQLHSIRSPIVQARVTANVTPAAVIAFKKPVSLVSERNKPTEVPVTEVELSSYQSHAVHIHWIFYQCHTEEELK